MTKEKVTDVIIMFTMDKSFVEWLDAELGERGWSPTELARRSGLSQSAISLVLSGDRNPGNKFCDGIARAFKLPKETVYRIADILDVKPNDDETVEEIVHIAHALSDTNKQDVRDYAKLRLEKQEKETSKHGKRDRIA